MKAFPKRRSIRWLLPFLVLGAISLCLYGFFWLNWPHRTDVLFSNKQYGITWSPPYARYLGVSSEQGLTDSLEELQVDHVRLSTEWSSIEAVQGKFQWSDLDRHLDILAAHHVAVTLAIGFKTPRWPECSHPVWAEHLSQSEREAALSRYLVALVRHVRDRKEIVAWQVENEPFFPFGACQPRLRQDIRNEYALVRALDPYEPFHRLLTVTDSGEQGAWLPPASSVDAIGFSVYRVTDNKYLGIHTYDWLPPWWYYRKALLLHFITGKRYYVSELQMEPWALMDMKSASIQEMFQTFSIHRMQVNHWELKCLGFAHIDLWGAEWWYWMKEQMHHPEFWEEAKRIFTKE